MHGSIIELATEHCAAASCPYLVVLGPTTSGKTDFSIQLAQALPYTVEIINADSRQLYTDLDIGTAKITPLEMQGVPHHLLSVVDPRSSLSIGWYKKEVLSLFRQIHSRGHIPMLVGGSMLYISAIIDNLDLQFRVSHDVRTDIASMYQLSSNEDLYAALQSCDATLATSIHPHNRRYLLRALEIIEQKNRYPVQLQPSEHESVVQSPFICGMYRNRSDIRDRIEARTKHMLHTGWIEEVQLLLDKGYTAEDPAMQSHGYREIIQYIHGHISYETMHGLILKNTRAFAKRQMTWWRHDARITWVDAATQYLLAPDIIV